ncbi:30S ribosomal protein S20 [Fusobacterium necrophorum subsp. funduliforme 1_1_36S]|nr:30S ribosomal protein S20 [Fusobacterium necrophorum subsp. funduliforme 1_1_36S]
MANSKSAKKRVAVAERNRQRNQAVKSRVKTMNKKVVVAVQEQDVETAKNALSVAYKELDKAVSKGIIKRIQLLERKQD